MGLFTEARPRRRAADAAADAGARPRRRRRSRRRAAAAAAAGDRRRRRLRVHGAAAAPAAAADRAAASTCSSCKVRIHQQLVERLDVQNLKTLPPDTVRDEVRIAHPRAVPEREGPAQQPPSRNG